MLALAAGALFGFASTLHRGAHRHREEFERHVADVCADAALRARAKAPADSRTP